MIYQQYLKSEMGWLSVEANESTLVAVRFVTDPKPEPNPNEICREAVRQLKSYFDGDLKQFDLPLEFSGSDFQKRVWTELMKIPYGRCISYLQLAQKLGGPNHVRAVGNANSRNPLAIVIPCHRVIGSNGKLVGYAGGLDRKQWLLSREGSVVKQKQQMSIF